MTIAPLESVTTNDGTVLRYTDSGTGPTLILICGWSQTAAQYQKQIDHFSSSHRVIAFDHRGHGQSDGPPFGYRISRLAADLNDLILALNLTDVALLGHSMGCSIIWSYWDLYGGKRVAKIILVDQPSTLVTSPAWEDGVGAGLSAIFAPVQTFELAGELSGPDGEKVSSGLLATMWTDEMSDADKAWIMEQNLHMPRHRAAELLVNLAFSDWRDVLPRLNVPTLVIGGDISLFPALGISALAKQIPGAELRIFSAQELGSHFLFWENSELFNKTVSDFLQDSAQKRGEWPVRVKTFTQ